MEPNNRTPDHPLARCFRAAVGATATLGALALATTPVGAARACADLGYIPVAWRVAHDDKGKPKKPPTTEGWNRLDADAAARTVKDGDNVGLLLRGTPFVVVDIDGEQGLATFLAHHIDHPLPRGPRVRTGRGWHLYFHAPRASLTQASVGKVDFFVPGEDRFVALPPSIHPNGSPYTWEDADLPVPDLPADRLAWLIRPVTNDAGRRSAKSLANSGTLAHPSGRNTVLTAFAGDLKKRWDVGDDLLADLVRMVNAAALWKDAGDPDPLDDREVRDILKHAQAFDQGRVALDLSLIHI